MAEQSTNDSSLEIAHILVIDVVGYSKLLIEDQGAAVGSLNALVRGTPEFGAAESTGKLLRLPTGDGMVLAFFTTPDAPVRCAVQLARNLRHKKEIRVRMGIHSGAVNRVDDVNDRLNLAGSGINTAQRIMSCGEADHILLSQHTADDLCHSRDWAPHLQDLGECEVKHGTRVHLVNLYGSDFGNPLSPLKVIAAHRRLLTKRWAVICALFLLVIGTALLVVSRAGRVAPPYSAGPVEEHSIAVLPLVDLSESKDQEYLCDGVSEELLDTLAKVPGLRVAARTSAFSFKGKNVDTSEIANQLGVANIIEGSLRRSGNRIRVTAQLINARTGFHLWSDTFEREIRDVFTVEDEITRAIVDALKVTLTSDTPLRSMRGDAEANDLYLQGLYFSNKSGEEALRKAMSFFQQTLDKDPKFSRAWAGLAKVWVRMADAYVKPLDAYPIAQAAAQKALALDEGDPEAHGYLGFSKKVLYWDQEAMLKEARRALEIDPNSALAHVWLGDTLRGRGDLNGAIEEYRTAASLDPLSPAVSDYLAGGYMIAGKLDDAIAQGKHTLELDPTYAYLDSTLANAYREKGLFDQAIALYRQAEQFTHSPSRGLAITYARAGKRLEAEQMLARFLAEREKHYVSAAAIGLVYGALGNKDEAFHWLERAYNEHDAVLTTIAFYPGSQPLRTDPRFIDLIERVGLDPAKAIPRDPR